jgi:hypothetical protein
MGTPGGLPGNSIDLMVGAGTPESGSGKYGFYERTHFIGWVGIASLLGLVPGKHILV